MIVPSRVRKVSVETMGIVVAVRLGPRGNE